MDELSKETPDISYVRGMLEVLIGEEEVNNPPIPRFKTDFPPAPILNMPSLPSFIAPNTNNGIIRMPIDNTNEAA